VHRQSLGTGPTEVTGNLPGGLAGRQLRPTGRLVTPA